MFCKIIYQPTSYSDILGRIFYMTLFSGIVCSIIIAIISPEIKRFLDSVSSEVDFYIKSVKVLYVFIPIVIALLLRIIKFHDRVSELFCLRYKFDVNYILIPLAKGAGLILCDNLEAKICTRRVDLMDKNFYKYASFLQPLIDVQLVRSAADNWGWFWSLVESSFIFLITLVITFFLSKWIWLFIAIVVISQFMLMIFCWYNCIKLAKRQIDVILNNKEWKDQIRDVFQSL